MGTPNEQGHNVAGPPELIIFDVNETLSDMSPMRGLWQDAGVPEHMAGLWFVEVLRDGFALSTTLQHDSFAGIARDAAHRLLSAAGATDVEASTERIMAGFRSLDVHPDVKAGIRTLSGLGIRLVTLSNGDTTVAEGLLTRSGLRSEMENLLSVEAVGPWKPAPESYQYALDVCGTAPDKAMLVAVHPWDINGASAAGLRTAWIARNDELYPSYFTPPEITAKTLVDLAPQVTPSPNAPPPTP